MRWWRWRPGFARRRLASAAGLDEPVPDPVSFVPSEVDANAHRTEIVRLADGLVHSVDEATGDVLDKHVNCWAGQWIATVKAEHLVYLSRADLVKGRAEAAVALTKVLWMHDLCRLVEMGMAVEATLTHLIEQVDSESARNGVEGGTDADRG